MLEDFKAYQLAKGFHLDCRSLKVSYFLKDQLLRASSSAVLNLAERSGKRTVADQRKFYSIALGSLRECEAILELDDIRSPTLDDKVDQLGAVLFTLSRPRKN